MLVRSVGLRGGGALTPAPGWSDDFESHAVGSGLPSGWAQSAAGGGALNPNWSVTDSAPLAGAKSLQGVNTISGQRGIIMTGSSLLDGELSVLVRSSGGGSDTNTQPGLIARVTDGDNWIGARISTRTGGKIMDLYQVLGGNVTHDSGSYAFALNTTYRLKLVLASGTATFTAYDTNDNLLATTSLPVSLAAGAVGLWFVGSDTTIKYDNFTASKA